MAESLSALFPLAEHSRLLSYLVEWDPGLRLACTSQNSDGPGGCSLESKGMLADIRC